MNFVLSRSYDILHPHNFPNRIMLAFCLIISIKFFILTWIGKLKKGKRPGIDTIEFHIMPQTLNGKGTQTAKKE